MPKSKKKPQVEAVVTVVADSENSDEDALDELIEAVEGLAERFSGVATFVGGTFGDEEEEDEDEEEDEEEDDDEEEEEDEDDEEEDDEEDEDEEDDEEEEFWTEAKLKRLSEDDVKEVAKGYGIKIRGKKKKDLIAEILADEDDSF